MQAGLVSLFVFPSPNQKHQTSKYYAIIHDITMIHESSSFKPCGPYLPPEHLTPHATPLNQRP